jgi:hypothetical protein
VAVRLPWTIALAVDNRHRTHEDVPPDPGDLPSFTDAQGMGTRTSHSSLSTAPFGRGKRTGRAATPTSHCASHRGIAVRIRHLLTQVLPDALRRQPLAQPSLNLLVVRRRHPRWPVRSSRAGRPTGWPLLARCRRRRAGWCRSTGWPLLPDAAGRSGRWFRAEHPSRARCVDTANPAPSSARMRRLSVILR